MAALTETLANFSAKATAATPAAAKLALAPSENLLPIFSMPLRSFVAFLMPLLLNFVMKEIRTERLAISLSL